MIKTLDNIYRPFSNFFIVDFDQVATYRKVKFQKGYEIFV